MTEQRVSSRYAHALLDAAKQENLVDVVFKDFLIVSNYIDASKDLRFLFDSPVVSHIKKKHIFTELFDGKINNLTINFMHLLAEKRRESLIQDIIVEYKKQYYIMMNKLIVDIVSANSLDDNMVELLKHKLAYITGKDVICNFSVNKDLKGGIQIRIDDWVYDASVANQLEKLKRSLAGSS